MNVKKASIIGLACIMIVVNSYVLHQYPMDEGRILRCLTSLVFLILFSCFGGLKKKKLAIAFVLLFVTDVFICNYDLLFYNYLTSVSKTLTYIFISWHLLPKFKLVKDCKKTLIIYFLIILISGLLLFKLVDAMSMIFLDGMHRFLYLTSALFLLISLVLAGNYNFRYNSRKSTACIIFMFLFVFSDLFGFI